MSIERHSLTEPRPIAPVATAPLLGIALALLVLLIAFAHGYGYHRDELYFLVAGHHLAVSYPDQGPLTPLLARVLSDIDGGSLTILRAPSALMMAGCTVVSGLIAREFGGSRRAQLIAAACTASAPVLFGIGHLLSTSTYDLFAWTVVSWLIVRAVRTGETAAWIGAGSFAGTALLNKPLILVLLAAVALGLLLTARRTVWWRTAPWMGLALAVLLWLPWLIWQAEHGWPQLHISSSIASGGSASSQPRWALIPFQFLLAGPPLAPVWVAGLIALSRSEELRPYRFLAISWLALVVVFELAGGKPYYLSGMLPVLFAAGALPTDAWLMRGRTRVRGAVLLVALGLGAIAAALIDLPILPVSDAGPLVAMNADVGETIGWPELVQEVAAVDQRAPQPAVIVTQNYGEAGAIDHFGSPLGLPPAYSGHNAFGEWGPPPGGQQSVVTVGLSWSRVTRFFRGCQPEALIANLGGIDNEEHGKLIALCAAPRQPWPMTWPHLRHLS